MDSSPINIRRKKNVKLSPEDEALAAALALDDKTIAGLVEFIFAQLDTKAPPS